MNLSGLLAAGRRNAVRAVGLAVLTMCLAVVAGGAGGVGSGQTASVTTPEDVGGGADRGLTVVTTSVHEGNIFAFDSAGEVVYHNDSLYAYWDVDPVQGTAATVWWVGTVKTQGPVCKDRAWCYVNVIEEANLTTGETTRLYSQPVLDIHHGIGKWHDADRTKEGNYLVAAISEDAIYEVDPEAGVITWGWKAVQHFDTESGGDRRGDWTHLNDVEAINESVVMVNVRNHDQVLFVHRERGVLENLTLGVDDDHGTLYEAHNADYIPERRGGPAVIVGDSENDRAIEYQLVDGEWTPTWSWTDNRLSWPRDADRLPNGHTLITDSHGDRVVEVDQGGTVVWALNVNGPYEAERLGSGDESAGGPAATTFGQITTTNASAPPGDASGRLPPKLVHAVEFVTPPWLTPLGALSLLLAGLTTVTWLVLEARWYWWSSSTASVGREVTPSDD